MKNDSPEFLESPSMNLKSGLIDAILYQSINIAYFITVKYIFNKAWNKDIRFILPFFRSFFKALDSHNPLLLTPIANFIHNYLYLCVRYISSLLYVLFNSQGCNHYYQLHHFARYHRIHHQLCGKQVDFTYIEAYIHIYMHIQKYFYQSVSEFAGKMRKTSFAFTNAMPQWISATPPIWKIKDLSNELEHTWTQQYITNEFSNMISKCQLH